MLYFFVRPLATLAFWLFYRKIYISNADRIPTDKPVVLAANHPTGFVEPCILACYLPQPLWFLARGDLFVKPFYIRLLRGLHLLPLYRTKDRGFAFVKNNFETFDYCYKALSEKKTVLILAEGSSAHEKRLRPLKKGTARIAFGTLERFPEVEDVYVVPVGVNYEYGDQPRSKVMIDFGEPISTRHFWESYQQNPTQTGADFAETLRQKMAARVVIIDHAKDEELTEYLLQLDRSQRPAYFSRYSSEPLQAEKRVADTVNRIDEPQKTQLLNLAKPYFEALQKLNITDAALFQKSGSALVNWVLLLLGLPFFIIGYIFNVLPILLAKNTAKTRVRRVVFYSSVWLAVALGGYFFYWLLWAILLLIFAKPLYWLALIIIPLLGIFAIHYQEFYNNVKLSNRVKQLNKEQKATLLQARMRIWNDFQEIETTPISSN